MRLILPGNVSLAPTSNGGTANDMQERARLVVNSVMKGGPRMADCLIATGATKQLDGLGRFASSVATDRQAHPSSRSRDGDLIRATLERQKAHRERVFSQDLPFSWLRLLVGLVSVAFVLTDVPRSGLGVSDLGKYYPVLEPDTTTASGMPWYYTVFRATRDEASDASVRVWSYKFDTTSVVWRAFAQRLSVAEFPECLHYRERCPSSVMSGGVVFAFVDALVDAVAKKLRPPPPSTSMGKRKSPRKLTLRTESEFIDRVHEFLLPSLFETRIWRTNEAIFFPAKAIESTDASGVCFGSPRPFFCQQIWINFDRSCPRGLRSCRQVGHVYTHTMQRLRDVQERFPNASVDLTFLTSAEDLQVSRLSVSVEGNQRADISTVIRARRCSSSSSIRSTHENAFPPSGDFDQDECETIYVEDYRYEIDILVSDAVQWYRFLVFLRGNGQGYFFVRALALVASCYYALGPRLSSSGETMAKRWRKTAHLLSKVPTQCIVFGSPFPILCYTVAHIIDASIMYRILEKRFISQNGILDLSLREFITVVVIQMRSVWVYAMLLHLVVKSATWHRWSGWTDGVIGGVTGVSEFLLTAMASANIITQFRSTRFRSTRVVLIQETVSPGGKSAIVMLRQHLFTHQGGGKDHLGGVLIDIKFLVCLTVVVAIVSVTRAAFVRLRTCRSHSSSPSIDSLIWPRANAGALLCGHPMAGGELMRALGERLLLYSRG